MRKHKLWMNDIVFDEESIIFASGQFNGLFRVGIYGGEAELINFFPNDPKLQSRLYGDAFKYKDEILFLPDLSDYITLYNITQKNFTCMKFPVEDENPAKQYWPKIVGGILVDSCVYAFGAKYPCVVCYNFETKQLKIYDERIEHFEMNGYKAETVFFSRDICRVENSIFVRSYTSDVIVEFDTITKKFDFHRVENQSLSNSCDVAERIWLLKEEGTAVYAWNKYDGLVQRLELERMEEEDGQNFQCHIFFKNKIWFFPYLSGSIMVVDAKSGKSDTMDLFEGDTNKWYQDDALGAVWFRKIYKNKLYFMSVLDNKLYCFSDNEKEELCTDIYVDKNKIIRSLFPNKQDFREPKKEGRSLWKINYDLIDAVMADDWDKTEQKGNHIEVGRAIYDYMAQL